MKDESKDYRRLLDAALGFKDRFAFILIRSPYFEMQREWQGRLYKDLEKENIKVIDIRGNELQEELKSIISFIKTRIPKQGKWILSLSHFNHHMMPTFTNHVRNKEISAAPGQPYQPQTTPPSFLQQLNLQREEIMKIFPVPFLLWVSPSAVRQLAEYAPDFYDFRQFIIDLPEPYELQTLPNIPRNSIMKSPRLEKLPDETIEKLIKEVQRLRTTNRDIEDTHQIIRKLVDLGSTDMLNHKLDDAFEKFREALEEAEKFNLVQAQAGIHSLTALLYQEMKKLDEALAHQEKAVSLYRTMVQDNELFYRPGLVNALNRQAIILCEKGNLQAAQKIYKESLALSRELVKKEGDSRVPLLGEVLNNYAILLVEQKKYKEAEEHYREAERIFRNVSIKQDRILLALILNNLGNLLASLNRLNEALLLHQEALHLRRFFFTKNPEYFRDDLCQSLYNLSLLLGEMGDYKQARDLFEEAIQTMVFLPDSGFEFLGCTENQTKIIGLRIELGEIEQLLSQHPAVKDAVVMVWKNESGEQRLTAYLVPCEGEVLERDKVSHYLAEKLPSYMIPSYFVSLDKIPLTPNGKVDRKSLPDPELWIERIREKIVTPPRNETEKKICEMMTQVLRMNGKIGIHDNFFELGGNPLRAIKLLSMIVSFYGIKISLADIFRSPTVAGIAKLISEEKEEKGL